jgi:hypothetical protein
MAALCWQIARHDRSMSATVFFLHSNVVPDQDHIAQWPDAARRMTLYATFVAGALTSAIDRLLPVDHPEMRDFARAAGFRGLAEKIGFTPADLAHRYALSLDVDTLVLGVKNRQELAECVAAGEAGPLPPELMARVEPGRPFGVYADAH